MNTEPIIQPGSYVYVKARLVASHENLHAFAVVVASPLDGSPQSLLVPSSDVLPLSPEMRPSSLPVDDGVWIECDDAPVAVKISKTQKP